MASINYAAREISVKIVYYGPGLSGKTTNLQIIHRKVPKDYKSDMVSLATETDRTLFFDFLPLNLGKIKGFSAKFQLYTVPGQVYYSVTRKLVLRGVDGIVFVADSAADKMDENLESFQNMLENLAEYGYKREEIPIVLQYNKRDLPNALSAEEMNAKMNNFNLPTTEAIAFKGDGVFETLKLIGKVVIDELNRKYARRTAKPSAPVSAPAPAAPTPAPVTPPPSAPPAQAQQAPAAAPVFQPPQYAQPQQQQFAPQQPQAAPAPARSELDMEIERYQSQMMGDAQKAQPATPPPPQGYAPPSGLESGYYGQQSPQAPQAPQQQNYANFQQPGQGMPEESPSFQNSGAYQQPTAPQPGYQQPQAGYPPVQPGNTGYQAPSGPAYPQPASQNQAARYERDEFDDLKPKKGFLGRLFGKK